MGEIIERTDEVLDLGVRLLSVRHPWRLVLPPANNAIGSE